MGKTVLHAAALDEAVEGHADRALEFLDRLVAAPSVLGQEREAQMLVAAELERLGFAVEALELPEEIGKAEGAGVPQLPPVGRPIVFGRRGGTGRSLLLNGHVDVVPAGPSRFWSSDPFVPRRDDGWLVGRGAGDMKGGFAMATLAVEAALAAAPDRVGPLTFVSAIEEECTGNGTLAAAGAGVLADAVIHPEPTNLKLLTCGAGILWFELEVEGRAAHAHVAGSGVNAIEAALPLFAALRELEDELNEGNNGRRHAVNLGTFTSGEWPSTVPSLATLGVRAAFSAPWTPAGAQQRVTDTIARAAARDPWLAHHPPRIRFNGFRGEPYRLDPGHPLARALADAHRDVHGSEPELEPGSATTDARFYINQFGVPAICYGPRVRNIHGPDEAVELPSVLDGARALARFIVDWGAT
jgi:acetylornithine deacetylase